VGFLTELLDTTLALDSAPRFERVLRSSLGSLPLSLLAENDFHMARDGRAWSRSRARVQGCKLEMQCAVEKAQISVDVGCFVKLIDRMGNRPSRRHVVILYRLRYLGIKDQAPVMPKTRKAAGDGAPSPGWCAES